MLSLIHIQMCIRDRHITYYTTSTIVDTIEQRHIISYYRCLPTFQRFLLFLSAQNTIELRNGNTRLKQPMSLLPICISIVCLSLSISFSLFLYVYTYNLNIYAYFCIILVLNTLNMELYLINEKIMPFPSIKKCITCLLYTSRCV